MTYSEEGRHRDHKAVTIARCDAAREGGGKQGKRRERPQFL